MNEACRSCAVRDGASFWSTIPRAVSWTLASVFALGVSVFAFVLFVVHNCIFLLLLLAFSSLLIALLYWNACNWRRHSLAFFLSHLPNSDLSGAADGQYVKVTGVATCGSVVYESSYEKAARCVYTSTSLYQYEGTSSLLVNNAYRGWSLWKLIYSERLVTDFFVTDRISGLRVMVMAGFGSKVIPLVDECTLVNTRSKSRTLSPYLKNWLSARNLSCGSSSLCLEEGYIEEGKSVSVVGVLRRSDDGLTIVDPPEALSTGCQWRRMLFPLDIEGVIFRPS